MSRLQTWQWYMRPWGTCVLRMAKHLTLTFTVGAQGQSWSWKNKMPRNHIERNLHVRCFYNLIGLPVVYSVVCTWFHEIHTSLFKVQQHMSEQKQRHEVQGIVCRLQKQDCFEAQIWKEVQKISAALKVPVSTVSSIIHKREKFGFNRTLPRAGYWPIWVLKVEGH